MKKRLIALLAVLVLTVVCMAFAVSADNTVQPNAVPAAYNGVDACPHCGGVPGTDFQWVELTADSYAIAPSRDTHYIVSTGKTLSLTSNMTFNTPKNVEVVLYVRGTIQLASGKTLRFGNDLKAETVAWIIGGGGTITGPGVADVNNGSILRLFYGSTVYITNDVTLELSNANVGTEARAGIIDINGGTVYMQGGTVNGYDSTNASAKGAVYLRDSVGTDAYLSSFVMTGGTVNGGNTVNGAAIYTNYKGSTVRIGGNANVYGGAVTGSGSAIYCSADADVIVEGNARIFGGTAADGGVLYMGSGTATMTGGTVVGGTATAKGGVIYLAGGEVNLNGADIVGGTAKNGGAIYAAADTVINMTAGTVSGANGLGNGGTVYLAGTMNMSGGTVTVNPNNTYDHSKGIRVNNGVLNLSGSAKVISAGEKEGDGVYAVSTNSAQKAKVTLADNATVCNPDGTWENVIFLSNWGPDNSTTRYASKIEVAAGWNGSASVKFGYIYSSGYAMPGAEYTVGMHFPAAYAAAAGDFDGKLYMEMVKTEPTIHWDGETGLKASDVQILTKDGTDLVAAWYKSNAAAVAAYREGYIKLYNADPVNLDGKNVSVDFNGNHTEVTLAGGKLYGFDSAATAEVTVTDGDAEVFAQNMVTEAHSVALVAGGKTTFHDLQVRIASVSLRPGNAGLYYTARFVCDDAVKAYVDSFGVAVSLEDVPGEDFETDAKTLYTGYGKDKLADGQANSVLIQNVMKAALTPDANKERAEKSIYANAYLKLTVNGQTQLIMADKSSALSMKTVLQRVNGSWVSLSQTDRDNLVEQIYTPYVDKFTVNDWDLFHMEAAMNGEPMNRELKILTIGNSLSVDAGRMLAYVAQQEGAEGIKVGTLYKANCSVQEHADFLTNNKPNYWYYESGFNAQNPGTLTAGSLVPSETKDYVGYDALVAEDWDIIIMQHSVFGAGSPATYDESIDTIIDYVNTHKTNPNAILAWNMTWMPPVDDELLASAEEPGRSPGFSNSYINQTKDPLDREAQTMMYEKITGAVQDCILSSDHFVYVLPSATMMQNALTATSDKVMYRDYIHGSDYGRLMNAYLWYSMFTGKTITEPAVDYIPGALRYASADRSNDLTLTQRMKDILSESVRNAIANPFEETVSQYQKEESLKVLAIGNSFSQDAMRHLEEIARSEGYADIKLGNLYIGGSSLETNWSKAEGDLGDYTYYYNYDGNWEKTANYKISQAMADQDWDIVTLQQASGSSGQSSTFEPYLKNLIGYIQQNEPGAKIVWHMTWAYAQDSTQGSFPNYGSDQLTMYNAIVEATQQIVVPYKTAGTVDKIIPSGTAIQNARTGYVGDEFDRDGYHLNVMGRIVAACTWYSVLTGNELEELSVTYFEDGELTDQAPVTLTDRDKEMILEAVNNAVEKPYEVTAAN